MTDITAEEALKSKTKFTEFMSDTHPLIVTSTLAGYTNVNGQSIIFICDLTQKIETLTNALNEINSLNLSIPPFIVWYVTSEKEELLNATKVLNRFSKRGLKIFIFKAFLNDNKMNFECVLKPEKNHRVETSAKQYQLNYWSKYFEICDELGSDVQINPQTQHWQYIAMGKRGVSLMLTTSTQIKYIGVDLVINYDKKIFNELLEHKEEIENELGHLLWINKEKNKSSKIRKVLNFDITDETQVENAIRAHIKMAEDYKKVFSRYLVEGGKCIGY